MTTNYALNVAVGLPEVIYTSEGNLYLHLPGVIMAESAAGEVRYLLSDGLGSIRHVTDEAGTVVAYQEFDPYGQPVSESEGAYGFTGEWFEDDIGLLHLRARWYSPEHGVFLSRDPWEGNTLRPQTLNGLAYVLGNPTNFTDPSGLNPPTCSDNPTQICYDPPIGPGNDGLPLPTPQPPRGTGTPDPTPYAVPVPTPPQGTPIPTPFKLVPSFLENANGYVEGYVETVVAAGCVIEIKGQEIVYDFKSRQANRFVYREAHQDWEETLSPIPGLSPSLGGVSAGNYAGFLWGFDGNGVVGNYEGYFVGTSLGWGNTATSPIYKDAHASGAVGWGQFSGARELDFQINGVSGHVVYFGGGVSVPLKGAKYNIPIDASLTATWYDADPNFNMMPYRQDLQSMLNDVRYGTNSPALNIPSLMRDLGARVGANQFIKDGLIKLSDYQSWN